MTALGFKDLVPELKKLLVQALVDQIMATAVKSATYLAWPVVGPVARFVLNQILWFLVDETAIALTCMWIVVDLQYEVDSVEKATLRLRDIIANPVKYTEQELKDIEANFDDKAVNLIYLAIRQY